MSESQQGSKSLLSLDHAWVGCLITLLLIDIIVYLATHSNDISNYIKNQKVTTEYFIVKQFLIWLTAIVMTIAIPRVAYINIAKNFPETKRLLTFFSYVLAVMIALSFITTMYFTRYILLLAPIIALYTAGMGWWIQGMTTARNSKRSHTINTILSTRTNETYQKNLKEYTRFVPGGFFLDRRLCEAHVNKDKTQTDKTYASLAETFCDQMDSCIYILNYFEFIAEAIQSNDFDEKLVRDCFGGFFRDLDSRLCYLIIEARKRHHNAFCAFVDIVKKWNDGKSKSIDHENTENDKSLGMIVPSPDYIEKNRQHNLSLLG